MKIIFKSFCLAILIIPIVFIMVYGLLFGTIWLTVNMPILLVTLLTLIFLFMIGLVIYNWLT